MSTTKLSSTLFRLWVQLHDGPLARRDLRAMWRESRRVARGA